jgi:hypothetical protein
VMCLSAGRGAANCFRGTPHRCVYTRRCHLVCVWRRLVVLRTKKSGWSLRDGHS